MAKVAALLSIVVVLSVLQQCTAVLECYVCNNACEVSKAEKKPCGATISQAQEAFCVTEFPKGKEDATEKIRKCSLVTKGTEPMCNTGNECKKCNTDLCNAAPSTSANVAIGFATFVLVKFLL